MSCTNCKNLEEVLLEYVERYGLTPSARQYFGASASPDAQREQQHSTLSELNLTGSTGSLTTDLNNRLRHKGSVWLFVQRFLLCFGAATLCIFALNFFGWC
jgi:hypothetical protein